MAALSTTWTTTAWAATAWASDTWLGTAVVVVVLPVPHLFRATETAGVRRAEETAGVRRA